MLRESLASIKGADQVILADDGSDSFDPLEVAAEFNLPGFSLVLGPKVSPEERMHRPSCGKLMNAALRAVGCDYTAYLCDDDLFAPDWLPAARDHFDSNPNSHMVMGDWMLFDDGKPLSTAVLCPFEFLPPLTTGNFAHRTECAGGCGCWWDESTLAVHDAAFLTTYLRRHSTGPHGIAHVGVVAGYRREHPNTMSHHVTSDGRRYKPSAAGLFAAGSVE